MSTPDRCTPSRAGTDRKAQSSGVPAWTDLDGALAVFQSSRELLFRIAFRVVHDIRRAEDCLQDAWVRWQLADRAMVRNPSAFLATTVRHLALNTISSATARREMTSQRMPDEFASVGEQLAPLLRLERRAAVAEALRMMLARMSGIEIGAFLLREGLGYPYADVARVLGTSIPNARQVMHRARAALAAGRERPVAAEEHRTLVAAFLLAARCGEVGPLERSVLSLPRGAMPDVDLAA